MAGQYANDQLLHPNTNKPETQTADNHPIFWCGICCVKLKTPFIAIQHLMGRSHCAKVKYRGHRRSPSPVSQSPGNIYTESLASESQFLQLRCNACDREFDSVREIEVHLKGKQHLANLKHERPRHYRDGNPVDEKKDLAQLWPVSKGSQNEDDIGYHTKVERRPKCEICNLDFNSTIVRDAHYKGKRHAAHLLLINDNNNNDNNNNYDKNWYDTANNQTAYVPTMNSMMTQVSSPNADTVVNTQKQRTSKEHFNISDIKLSCKDCNMSFNSAITSSHHFNGRKHAAMMELLKSRNGEQSSASKRKHSDGLHEQYDQMMNLINDKSNSVDSDVKKIKDAQSPSTLTPPEKKIAFIDRGIVLGNQSAATQHFTGKRHAKEVAREEVFTGQQHAKYVAREEADLQRDVMSRWQNGDKGKKAPVGRGRFGMGGGRGRGRGPAGIGYGRAGIEHGPAGFEHGPAGIEHGRPGIEHGRAGIEYRSGIGYNMPTGILLGYPGIGTLGQSHFAGNMLRSPNIIPGLVNGQAHPLSKHFDKRRNDILSPIADQFVNMQPGFMDSSSELPFY